MELAPYGKQQGRRRESEGWKRRGKDHQWWKISNLPSREPRELTYPTLGKERKIIFKSVFGMGYVSSKEGKIYDVWFLMNIWKFLWCWMISAAVGCWLCWLSSTPHNQRHHPSSLHPGATRSPNYQLLGRSIDKWERVVTPWYSGDVGACWMLDPNLILKETSCLVGVCDPNPGNQLKLLKVGSFSHYFSRICTSQLGCARFLNPKIEKNLVKLFCDLTHDLGVRKLRKGKIPFYVVVWFFKFSPRNLGDDEPILTIIFLKGGWFNHQRLYSFISGKSIGLVKYDKLARMMIVQPEGFGSSNCDGSQKKGSIHRIGRFFWIFLHPKRDPTGGGTSPFFPLLFCHDRKVRGLPGIEHIWTVKKCLRRDECWWFTPWKRTARPSFRKLRKMNFPLHGCDVECRWYTSMKKQPTDLRVDYNNAS